MAYIVINDVSREVFLRKKLHDFLTHEKIMYKIPDEQVCIYEDHYTDANRQSLGGISQFTKKSDEIRKDLERMWANTRRFFKLV